MRLGPRLLRVETHEPLRAEEHGGELQAAHVDERMVGQGHERAVEPGRLWGVQSAHRLPEAELLGRHDYVVDVGPSQAAAEGVGARVLPQAHAQTDLARARGRRGAAVGLAHHGREQLVLSAQNPCRQRLLWPHHEVEVAHPHPRVDQRLDVRLARLQAGERLGGGVGAVEAEEVERLLAATPHEHQVGEVAHVGPGRRRPHVGPPNVREGSTAVQGDEAASAARAVGAELTRQHHAEEAGDLEALGEPSERLLVPPDLGEADKVEVIDLDALEDVRHLLIRERGGLLVPVCGAPHVPGADAEVHLHFSPIAGAVAVGGAPLALREQPRGPPAPRPGGPPPARA